MADTIATRVDARIRQPQQMSRGGMIEDGGPGYKPALGVGSTVSARA